MERIKKEISDWSGWFKVTVSVLFVIYLSLWLFTIYLSDVQKNRGIEPVLPGASKDSIEYIEMSESLISGNGLTFRGRVETLRTPGYPLFGAIVKTVGGSYFAVTFLQIILVFISAIFVRKIGVYFKSKLVGEISATLLLFNPVTVVLSLLILTDVLFLFLFVVGLYIATKINEDRMILKVLLASIFFAGAIYVRGMGIFAIPIFLIPMFTNKLEFKKQFSLALLTLFFLAISVTPWIIRNYVKVGVANFNSFESVNLSWIVPKFIASTDGTDEEVETQAFREATKVPESAWQDLSWHDLRYSKQINEVGEKLILARPFSYLKFHLITSIPFIFPSTILFARDAYDSALQVERTFVYGAINSLTTGDYKVFFQSIIRDWWKFGERILWLLALLVALYGVWKDRRNIFVWILVFIVGYLMMLSGPAAGPRLSFQAWPFFFLLFASGAVHLYQKFSRANFKIS